MDHFVYQVQSPQCLGFQIFKDKIYFMKQNKEVIVLVEQKDSIKLVLEKTLFLKEMDKINFKSSAFSKIIIKDTYVVSESKIFYLYEKEPHGRGIMDMEQLQELPDTPGIE
jgi:hypothetical protein